MCVKAFRKHVGEIDPGLRKLSEHEATILNKPEQARIGLRKGVTQKMRNIAHALERSI